MVGDPKKKMKRSLSRARSTRRGSSSPNRPLDSLIRCKESIFRLILHVSICIAALILGFRLSREAFLVVVSFQHPHSSSLTRTVSRLSRREASGEGESDLQLPYASVLGKGAALLLPRSERLVPGMPSLFSPPSGIKSRRVHVGRHEILIRPWPHPNPRQTMVAHQLLDRVQKAQRRGYGSFKERRRLLIITPTYVRTFQAVHFTCVMHTLRLVPYPLLWIVIEAGGASNETAALLLSSGISCVHLSFGEAIPSTWEEQHRIEMRMRVEGLRFVREQRLDGIVVFVDDSNTYSLEFFEEVQKVKWVGSLSVAHLPHFVLSSNSQVEWEAEQGGLATRGDRKESAGQLLPLQGPVCNSTGQLTGWYSFMADRSQNNTEDGMNPLRRLEWAGFVLNAQLLWEDAQKPSWIRSWKEWNANSGVDVESPLDMVKDEALVEPLGNCGRDVWIWWLRIEAPSDSKFPPRWVIDPPLDIVVPSKHTPWQVRPFSQPPPPPPSTGTLSTSEKQRMKKSARVSRGKRRSHHSDKRKQEHGNNSKQGGQE